MNRTIELGNDTYEFMNESFSNYHNWGHTSTLYKNGEEVSFAKAIYLNRTWEAYQYQSVMGSALYNYRDSLYNDAKDIFKESNNIKRLGGSKLELFKDSFNEEYKHLDFLKSQL